MSTNARSAAVLASLADIRGWQEELYRNLHQHPELSHQEHRTAGVVAKRLRAAGFSVHEGVGGTGVVGVLENGDGPAALLERGVMRVARRCRRTVREDREYSRHCVSGDPILWG